MVRKNPALNKRAPIAPKRYECELTLKKAIQEIYPDASSFTYPHGKPGDILNDGSGFISFNGRIGTVIYGYCDFADKKNVALSSTNLSDLLKLRRITPQEEE